MGKSLAEWKSRALGQRIDLDNQSYDCVDVSKHWAEYLTDKPWTTSLSWGNARDLYANNPGTYQEKIPRGYAPQLGDIVVMSSAVGGGYGHTGVVISIDGRNIMIAQQNTFTQQPVYTGVWDGYADYIVGYLRPKQAFSIDGAPDLQNYQRVVGDGGVNYRQAPSRNGAISQSYMPGEVLDFKGYVRGENVDGNNIWFVGRHTGGYAHSSGFTDMGTHDLPDITPAAALQPHQRQVGNDVMVFNSCICVCIIARY